MSMSDPEHEVFFILKVRGSLVLFNPNKESFLDHHIYPLCHLAQKGKPYKKGC